MHKRRNVWTYKLINTMSIGPKERVKTKLYNDIACCGCKTLNTLGLRHICKDVCKSGAETKCRIMMVHQGKW